MRRSAIIVGGGFYGCAIACHLAEQGWSVTLLEREPELMSRASYVNQARLHNGYHYPRSFRTAIRSRANLPVFREVYGEAIAENFRMLYAIARISSHVDAMYYRQFCRAAGVALRPAGKADRQLFDPRLIQDVFIAEEPAFDAAILRRNLEARLAAAGVDVHRGAAATAVTATGHADGGVTVRFGDNELAADWVFNCTYAALSHIDGRTTAQRPILVHKLSEIVLIDPPDRLKPLGITVMDGPFFSVMPFPARGLHSLTHVRHTHHLAWKEGGTDDAAPAPNPLDILAQYLAGEDGAQRRSKALWMIKDAQRFLPALADARIIDRLYEVKSLVSGTEFDDARPIYFHRDSEIPNFVSILGGKIDNIFDVLSYIDALFEHRQSIAR